MPARRTIIIFSALLFGGLLSGCTEDSVEKRLKTLTGTHYLSFTEREKAEFVADSIEEFSEIRKWRRQDFLCDYVLDRTILARLYENAAEKAQDNFLSQPFFDAAKTECMNQGDRLK